MLRRCPATRLGGVRYNFENIPGDMADVPSVVLQCNSAGAICPCARAMDWAEDFKASMSWSELAIFFLWFWFSLKM